MAHAAHLFDPMGELLCKAQLHIPIFPEFLQLHPRLVHHAGCCAKKLFLIKNDENSNKFADLLTSFPRNQLPCFESPLALVVYT